MISVTKPRLKIENNKLYFSRKPRIVFWLFFTLIIIFSAIICHCVTNGVFLLTTFILGEIIFGLEAFGDWEELTLDRKQNLVIFSKNSWCEKLLNTNPVEHFFKSKLTDIRHVGVSQNIGLFILPRNGKVVCFGTRGLTRDEIQNVKRDITFFLDSSRTECPENHFLNISESQQYLENLLQKCHYRDNLKNRKKMNFSVPVHQHHSSPLLGDFSKKNVPIWNKQPYDTDNLEILHHSHLRRRNSVPRR